MRLAVRDGVAEVTDGQGPADLEIDASALASIVVSGLGPSDAERLGLLRAKRSALRAAEDVFSGPRFLCLDPF